MSGDNLDLDLIEVIHISLPDASGKHHVCDGWHRINALRKSGWEDNQKVQCLMHHVSTSSECARLFVRLNTGKRAPNAIDKYITSVEAGLPDFPNHVAVDAIVRAVGYKVENTAASNAIKGVNGLLSSYHRWGSEALRRALEVIRDTWGKDGKAMTSPTILGYATFIARYGEKIDYQRLEARMAKTYTPTRLQGDAKSRAKVLHISEGEALFELVRDTYDSGLSAKKKLNGKDKHDKHEHPCL